MKRSALPFVGGVQGRMRKCRMRWAPKAAARSCEAPVAVVRHDAPDRDPAPREGAQGADGEGGGADEPSMGWISTRRGGASSTATWTCSQPARRVWRERMCPRNEVPGSYRTSQRRLRSVARSWAGVQTGWMAVTVVAPTSPVTTPDSTTFSAAAESATTDETDFPERLAQAVARPRNSVRVVGQFGVHGRVGAQGE